MDLGLYLSVLRRHRRIVVVGIGLAGLLAFYAAFRVGSDGVALRSSPVYASEAILLVSQAGSAWGDSPRGASGDAAGQPPTPFDPSRLQYLASLYASLAQGDNIRLAAGLPLDRAKPHIADYDAFPLRSKDGNLALPLLSITAKSVSEARAVGLTRRVVAAFRASVERTQVRAGIGPSDRVDLSIVQKPESAKVVEPRRFTRPIMAFLLMLMLTVAAAFVAENLGRRSQAADTRSESGDDDRVRPTVAPLPTVTEVSPVTRVPSPAGSAAEDDEGTGRLDRLRMHEARRRTLGS